MIYIKLMLSWKSNLKNAAGWLIWQDAYVGMVPFQHPFAYRKTQTAPADRAASGFVHPEKRFKNGIPIVLWNTLALIGSLYLHGIFFFLYRSTYLCIMGVDDAQSGTVHRSGRHRAHPRHGVPDYEYADVTLGKNGVLDCSMVKIVPVGDSGQGAPSGQPALDPSAWYELEGRDVLDGIIADLRSRGHSSLTLNEDSSISFQPEAGGRKATKRAFGSFPGKVYWPRLADVLAQEGLTADVQADHIAVSW